MNRNQQVLNNLTHFWLQVDEINESLKSNIDKRLKTIHADLISSVYQSRGQLTNRNTANLIAGSLTTLLSGLVTDINESLYIILQRSRVAVLKFLNRPLKTEALDLSVIDPFGLTDLGDENNAFTIIGEILGISEDEARILFSELLLFGLSLNEVWMIFLLRQRDQLRQRLAQILSELVTDTGSINESTIRDIQRVLSDTLIGDGVNTIKTGIGSIATSVLFNSIQQMVKKTVERNPRVFTGQYIWNGILDSLICKRCAALHGKVFNYGEGPIPQLHIGCRCFITPLIEGGGDVSTQDFNEWLRSQSADVQDDILGKRGGDLFRQGKVRFKDFIQFKRKVFPRQRTIEQIERIGNR
jgi:SPP1 gp7 family putative phage head morphogenesis protein